MALCQYGPAADGRIRCGTRSAGLEGAGSGVIALHCAHQQARRLAHIGACFPSVSSASAVLPHILPHNGGISGLRWKPVFLA
ncbi:MAG: hypothetical protein AB7U20_02320 [Planctomycetaceae bacterium]